MNEADRTEEAVFEAALQLRPTERTAYLDQACAGDPGLRQRIEALLGALDRAGALLNEPAVPRPEAPAVVSLPPTAKPGDRIGRYKLLQQIGEGGCGVVFMAEQEEPVRRRVALKVIKLGMDTKSVIARFEAERQALALMDHPNIAKVLDAGATDTGRPYFVMELVRGVRITEYCDEHNLPMRQRLELFIQVCQAVQHAHQKGIIHRDIKPSNILVTVNDGVPVPKVIDFGIAKATTGQPLTDKTLFTAFEQFIGTPAYMSPEQAVMTSQDIDTRSDIYSLGVLLYELLTGKTPFDAKELLAAGLDEMRRTIRDKEPPKPSTRLTQELVAAPRQSAADSATENGGALPRRRYGQIQELIHALRGDLDWIVMKCLEKDRTRRYETANGLATDLKRHLNNEPVTAVAPSAGYKFRKFARRNKVAFAVAATIATILVLATGISVWQAVRATRAEALAKATSAQLKQADQVRTKEMYRSYLDQIRAKRQSGIAGHRQEGFDLIAKAVAIRPSLELRNEAIATLATMDVRPGRTWNLPSVDGSIPYYFDGKLERYAFPDGTNGILFRRVLDDAEVAVLNDPARSVRLIHGFSPNGRYLAATYREQKHWTIWDVPAGRIVLDDPRCQNGITFSLEGDQLAASHSDGSIRLYDLRSGVEAASVKAGRSLEWLSLSASGDRVLGCDRGSGKEVGVWTFATGAALTLTAPDQLDNADWGGDDLIAAGSYQGRIHVWSAKSGQLLHSIEAHEANIALVRFNHRGDLVASTGWDGTTRFCNPWTGQLYLTFPHHTQVSEFSHDDRLFSLTLLALGPKGRFAFLEMEESSVVKRIEHGGNIENAWRLAFSPDGRWLAAAHGQDGGVRLYETDTRRLLASLPESTGRMVLFEPEGKSLLTGGPEGITRWALSESRNGPTNTVRFGPRQPVSTLTNILHGALTPDGRWLACTSERATNQVWLVDLANPDPPVGLGRHRSGMNVAISPDGEWVASGNWHGMEGVKVWRTRTRTLEKTIPMAGVLLAYSPDGRWLAVSGTSADNAYQLQLWETGTWTLRHSWTDSNSLNQAVFSPDSRIVAFVSERRKIRLHEVESFRHLATLEAPSSTYLGWLQFSPDGNRLAALERTHGIQLWDLPALRLELRTRGLDWEPEPLEKSGRR